MTGGEWTVCYKGPELICEVACDSVEGEMAGLRHVVLPDEFGGGGEVRLGVERAELADLVVDGVGDGDEDGVERVGWRCERAGDDVAGP